MDSKISLVILGSSGFVGTALEIFTAEFHPEINLVGSCLGRIDLSIEKECLDLVELIPNNSCLMVCAGIKKQFGDTIENLLENNKIADNIAKLITSSGRLSKVIYISSAEVYGHPKDILLSENTLVNPSTYYGAHKIYMEGIIAKACKGRGIGYCFPRPPLIYGDGDSSLSYGPTGFIWHALLNKQINVWGDGKELREFIYIDDLCAVLMNLVTMEKVIDGPLNIVSGISYSFEKLLVEIKKLLPKTQSRSKLRNMDSFNLIFDPKLIKSVMSNDFKFTSLRSGLKKMYESKGVLRWPQ
ncbi:NAD-dependent epimerase/dehydratase family protein [Polynucleobacter sp. IMCC30063]|uniref:SDR family oxidoreductase n=1 Tax=Polynucleobacter sp. IMCC30063 TaxID=2907298 RepID=UPI001F169570|nr:NAD-dependent epimerase/dehydratase family protein [Polynucleobacter sp. IMCC30063]MCE7505294.1 NAD-dependent epimerase/dehydratase family protein [Polynucleobacter sp. IMCC30063]